MNNNEITRLAQSICAMLEKIKSDPDFMQGPQYQSFERTILRLDQKRLVNRIRYFNKILSPVLQSGHTQSLLEVGCGYGINTLIFKSLGFKHICGIEIVPSISANAQLLIKKAQDYLPYSLDGCEVICGNAESTSIPDESFECVFAVEVISHVPSIDRFLREMNRILKTGGYFVVSDGNNLRCPYYRSKLTKIWKRLRETELKKRIVYLENQFPDIDPQFRASIALHTELLPLEAMKKEVPGIIKNNTLPMNLYFPGYAPIFSESGIWAEYGFYPEKLASYVEQYGFFAQVHQYIGSARNSFLDIAERCINLLPDVLRFLFRPSFLLYAQKNERTRYLID